MMTVIHSSWLALTLLSAAGTSIDRTAADSTPKFVAPKTLVELESRIRALLDSAKVPGIGLAIVRHDSVVYAGGLGLARVSPPINATDSTLFRIGSTSKAFVALTAQALVREGKLSLDQPLAAALPGFYFTNAWESTDPVRIVHLLEHTSGFDDNSLSSYANSDPTPLTLGHALALDSITRSSRWRPGTRFSYCNTGPAIVALIIERIEGKPFEQVVQDRWFTPIGMKTATYFRPDSTKTPVATLYRNDGTTPVPYWHVFIRPAGSINASSHDMAAYVRFLLGRGTINGASLLPAGSIERMERSASSLMARAGLAVGYGLHLYRVADTTGFTWTGHNGGVEGGLSDLSYLPTHDVGYAVQINSGNGEALGMVTRLVRAFLTVGLTPPSPPPIAPLSTALRAEFGGWYRGVSPRAQHLAVLERIPNLMHVTFTDSVMRLAPLLGDGQVLVPVDSVRFRPRGASEATLVFVRDSANDRPYGIESVGAGLGASMAKVPTFAALGSIALLTLWLVGLVLSMVAIIFGVLRWLVQRVRRTSHTHSNNSVAWRMAAVTAICVVAHGILFAVASDDVRTIGTRNTTSLSVWALGIAFGVAALGSTVVAWQTRARDGARTGRWERVSLWAVRGVTAVNVIAAGYLATNGWIGWRMWT